MGNGVSMWAIFGGLIVLLVIFFAYSSIKDKIKAKKKKKFEEKNRVKALELKRFLIFEVKALIEINQKYLDNFEPSIGEYKMVDVINASRKTIKLVENEDNFKEYIMNKSEHIEFLKAYVFLRDNRSNLWASRFKNVIDYIEECFKTYDMTLYKEEYDKAYDKVQKKYLEEFKKEEVAEAK